MKEETIQQQLKEVMAAMFSLELVDIGSRLSIQTIEQWDSLQHVNLMMALEQEFGVRIDVEDAVEMTSFSAICDKLTRYLGDAQ